MKKQDQHLPYVVSTNRRGESGEFPSTKATTVFVVGLGKNSGWQRTYQAGSKRKRGGLFSQTEIWWVWVGGEMSVEA